MTLYLHADDGQQNYVEITVPHHRTGPAADAGAGANTDAGAGANTDAGAGANTDA